MGDRTKENILLLGGAIQAARNTLLHNKFIELRPPTLIRGLANPLVPGVHCTVGGQIWHLSKDSSYSLYVGLKHFDSIFSVTQSFRDQANGKNRLLEFHYLQAVKAASSDSLQALTLDLFATVLNRTKEQTGSSPMPAWVDKFRSIESIPIMSYDEFVNPGGGSVDEPLSLDAEIALVEMHGGQPLVVQHYPRSVEPREPATRLISTRYGVALENYSLLLPGVGSVADGSEIELRKDQLQQQLYSSKFAEGIRELNIANKVIDDCVNVICSSGRRQISIAGVGLERLLQGLTGLASINEVLPFRDGEIGMSSEDK